MNWIGRDLSLFDLIINNFKQLVNRINHKKGYKEHLISEHLGQAQIYT